MQEHTRRRDAGKLQVTQRDLLALTWIAEQYCISYDQLQRLLALYTPATTKHPDKVAPSTAQNAVERWLQLGYIDMPQKVIREHSTYLWLSRKGMKDLALPYAYYQPKPSTIRHLYAVNAIRLHLQRYSLSAEWVAQRTLRLQTQDRPLPDAELHSHHASFLPIQLGIQVFEQPYIATITLRDELHTLQTLAERYTRLWYFVHNQARAPLQTAVHELDNATDLPRIPDDQMQRRIVWYSLDAKEIPTET